MLSSNRESFSSDEVFQRSNEGWSELPVRKGLGSTGFPWLPQGRNPARFVDGLQHGSWIVDLVITDEVLIRDVSAFSH